MATRQRIADFDGERVSGYVDWRLPERRWEAVARVTHHRYRTGDLDHGHSGRVICDELGLSDEQRAWFALLFGHSYRTYWAGIVMQKFPDLGHTDPMRLDAWLKAEAPGGRHNYNRMIYGNDMKWNTGRKKDGRQKLTETLQEVQKWAGEDLHGTLRHLIAGPAKDSRGRLNALLRSVPYLGWMGTWLMNQMLYDLFGWDTDVWELPLDGNWSVFNAMCYVANQEQDIGKPTRENVRDRQREFKSLMAYLSEHVPHRIDAYSIETVLCEHRKMAVGPTYREFIHWNSGEQNILYLHTKAKWPDADEQGFSFAPMLTGQMTLDQQCRGLGGSKAYYQILGRTGMLQNINSTFPDEPDVYDHLDVLRPEQIRLPEMAAEWEQQRDEASRRAAHERWNPAARLIPKETR